MTNHDARGHIIAKERNLLQRICRTGIRAIPPALLQSLERHEWAGRDHAVIFGALVRMASVPPASLHERFSAETTRMGFPDVAWEEFFAAEPGRPDSDRDLSELIAALFSASKHES